MCPVGISLYPKVSGYPDDAPFHPHTAYPEYPFPGHLSRSNSVYEAVRSTLHSMNLDRERFGTTSWNPLHRAVQPGDKVIVKPNLVYHSREPQDTPRVQCTITHGSVIRAVVDYVIIALQGNGTILIADTPIEEADFDAIAEYACLEDIVQFIRAHTDLSITYADLRSQPTSHPTTKSGNVRASLPGDSVGTVTVDLKGLSFFAKLDQADQNYLTMADWSLALGNPLDQTIGQTNRYHHAGRHAYNIGRSFLAADSIISICKLKTHKKAGVTLSLKNFIGIANDKICLPHHREGTPPHGDAFPRPPSRLGMGQHAVLEAIKRVYSLRRFVSRLLKPLVYLVTTPDVFVPIMHGNWPGNDTLWRTILDLNLIIRYADAGGTLTPGQKRRLFFFVDGIIGGDGDGPMQNRARRVGLIAAGSSSVVLDRQLAHLMGFDWRRIPQLAGAELDQDERFPIHEPGDDSVFWSSPDVKDVNLRFRPARGWKSTLR